MLAWNTKTKGLTSHFCAATLKSSYASECSTGTSNSAEQELNAPYFPSTLSRFPSLHMFPRFMQMLLQEPGKVLEFSWQIFFTLFITHVISTWGPSPITPVFKTCILFSPSPWLSVSAWLCPQHFPPAGGILGYLHLRRVLAAWLFITPFLSPFLPQNTSSLGPLCLCTYCPFFLKCFSSIQCILQNPVFLFLVLCPPCTL